MRIKIILNVISLGITFSLNHTHRILTKMEYYYKFGQWRSQVGGKGPFPPHIKQKTHFLKTQKTYLKKKWVKMG